MTAPAATFTFDDPRLAQFVVGATRGPQAMPGVGGVVPVADEIGVHLLERLNDGKTSLLQYQNTSIWMITGFDERDLVQTVARLERFLTPSYGRFTRQTANIQLFEPDKGPIHALGQQLSLAGYHRLETEPGYLENVQDAIRTWMRLEECRPAAAENPRPTYRELLANFRTALATSDWEHAGEVVEELSRHRLTSADNVIFLRLQLAAKQERWDAVWEDPSFSEWARQRVPRAIRSVLIQSFHHAVLLPRELAGDWEGALAHYRRERSRLGNLLETRLQEKSLPVSRVFAYAAVAGPDRTLATELRETLPDEVLDCITPILNLLPAEAEPERPPSLSVEEQAKIALFDGNLDEVRRLVGKIENAETRIVLVVNLANRSGDLVDVEVALTEITDLSSWRLTELYARHPYLESQVGTLVTLFVVPSTADLIDPPISPLTWANWLSALMVNGNRPDLEATLDALIAKSDERLWEPVEARIIGEHVLSLVAGSHEAPAALVRRAVDALVDGLLIDDGFPRSGSDYVDLYEATYTYLLEEATVNDANSRKLLRLAEAMLVENPLRVHDVQSHLRRWFAIPRTVLAERMLDGMELVVEYGIDGGALIGDIRPWIEMLLASPAELPSTLIHAWTAFAAAIHAGDDLIAQLREYGVVHPGSLAQVIAGLPAGFCIAIFTLRPKSAARVKESLSTMNPALNIQISTEKDLSPRVQQLAKTADLPVVVTTCITHALTYGIGPYLKVDPIRPDSSGSTSIMRSIEVALATL